ncbi:MAG: hypothetical protein HJJLKODD_00474 [Phycisphaerae bacterium]|nr:hypothetical protein [Phycisphaerae bacterium]
MTQRAASNSLRFLVGVILLVGWTGCGPGETNDNNSNQNVNDNSNGNTNTNLNSNSNQNDNSSGPLLGQVWLEFDLDPESLIVARALAGTGVSDRFTQYRFLGTKNPVVGTPESINQIDVILSNGVAVRVTLDSLGRPASFLASDDSALILAYNDEEGTVDWVLVSTVGATFSGTEELVDVAQPAQVDDSTDICALLAQLRVVTSAVFSGCETEPTFALCVGSIFSSSQALDDLCDSELILADLDDSTGEGPSLSVPLGVVAIGPADEVNPGTGITLDATAFGGTPPYAISWSVQDGPSTPIITVVSNGTDTSRSTATATLGFVGEYIFRATVTDNDVQIAYYDLTVTVAEQPDALTVSVSAEASETVPFTAQFDADVEGGVPPYSYSWTIFSGPTDEADFAAPTAASTEATFSEGGTYIVQVSVTDSDNPPITTVSSAAVTIIDPAVDLIAHITYPDCDQDTDEDTCAAVGEEVELGVDLINEEGTPAQINYNWSLVSGNASLTGASSSTPTLTVEGLGVIEVSVTVTDSAKGQTSSDSITIEAIQEGALTVEILTDSQAIQNQPEMLLSEVTNATGELTYEWEVTSGTGTFDDEASQNVQFTPTTRPSVTVRLTVTDAATDESATDTATILVSTFSATIVGEDEISSNSIENYTVNLSSSAPDEVSYAWTATKSNPSDSMTISILDVDGASTNVQVIGDGQYTLQVTVTDEGDSTNSTVDTQLITSVCAPTDIPEADAGTAQLAAAGAVVTLDCDSDSATQRTYTWSQLSGTTVSLTPGASGVATFTMPSGVTTPLNFSCQVSNTTTFCDATDTVKVYATPVVKPTDGTINQDVGLGSNVTINCTQTAGTPVATYTWEQVLGTAVTLDISEAGVLTFETPLSPDTLKFECAGIVEDAEDGLLTGAFSTANPATITNSGYEIRAAAKTGASAPTSIGGTYSTILTDRVRLNNQTPGYVVFASQVAGGSAAQGLFGLDVASAGQTSAVTVRTTQGAAAPAATGGTISAITVFDVNNSRQVGLVADITGGLDSITTAVLTQADGGALAEAYANGTTDANPGGKRYCDFYDVGLPGSGSAAIHAQFDNGSDADCLDDFLEGIYQGTSSLAVEGTTSIPGGSGGQLFDGTFEQLQVSNSGAVVFAASGATSTRFGAFKYTSSLAKVFLDNGAAGDTAALYTEELPADLETNATGLVFFITGIDNQPLGWADPKADTGLFNGNGTSGTNLGLNNAQTTTDLSFDLSTISEVAGNASGDVAFIADNQLFYYRASTGRTVQVYDAATTPHLIKGGMTIQDVDSNNYPLTTIHEVQLNDAGYIVFTANYTGGTGVFVAKP